MKTLKFYLLAFIALVFCGRLFANYVAEDRAFNYFLSPNGDMVATITNDGILSLWDSDLEVEIALLSDTTNFKKSYFKDVAFSPKSNFIAAVDWMGSVFIWDLHTLQKVQSIMTTTSFVSVSFSFDETMIATIPVTTDCVVLWDWQNVHEKAVFEAADVVGLKDVIFSRDDKFIAASSYYGDVVIWDLPSNEILNVISVSRDEVTDMAFSADGEFIATAVQNEVYWWSVISGRYLMGFKEHTDYVVDVDFGMYNNCVVSASNNEIIVWYGYYSEKIFMFDLKAERFKGFVFNFEKGVVIGEDANKKPQIKRLFCDK